MRETLIVPEGAVLEDEPAARLADSAPAFALVSMTAYPAGRVEVTIKAELLLMWDEIGIAGLHVFGWWWFLFFLEGGVEVRGVAEVRVMRVQ